MDEINIHGEWFKDKTERYLILRGVNLASKMPLHLSQFPFDRRTLSFHKNVSFVDRPIPLSEADEHFSRLKYWGFTFIRLSVLWEGLEHSGPGIYDEAYLDYLTHIIEKAGDYGITVFIDFHQDVWSRFSGGDGAPGWTLEKVGFDINYLEETGASVFRKKVGEMTHLLWVTNGSKLAAATMFTLFFGGNVFAPNKMIDGIKAQDFLQNHYIGAVEQVVRRLSGLKNVAGYDIMNEPLKGYIGWDHLARLSDEFKLGAAPTPFQSMLLGSGFSEEVAVFDSKMFYIKKVGSALLNPLHKSAWREGEKCVWKEHGVWDIDNAGNPKLLKSSHFRIHKGRRVNFEQDFYKPFIIKVAKAIGTISPKSMIFIENVVGSPPPKISEKEAQNIVFTGHWYDAFVLATKRFLSCIGFDMFKMKLVIALPRWIRKVYALQVYQLKKYAKEYFGKVPTVVSEFGIPFDLKDKKSYRTGKFSSQTKALHRSFTAIDDNLASATVWNYSPHNSNRWGDGWNDEDLSIFSRDQQNGEEHLYAGARAKEALIRPYCMKSAGKPVYMHFNLKKGIFEFIFEDDPTISHPTEIFLPHLHFAKGMRVELSDGQFEMDYGTQILKYVPHEKNKQHTIKIYKN